MALNLLNSSDLEQLALNGLKLLGGRLVLSDQSLSREETDEIVTCFVT